MIRIWLSLSWIGLILVGAASASHAQEIAPAEYARVNAALVETHALPRYERLATATDAFAAAAEAYCGGESDPDHAQLRVGFHDAMDAWMGVQHLRFGPVDSRMRGFRFYFWPQARNKAGEAVAELVAADEDDAALAARIGRANVAVQGLLAAEVLLYDERYLGAGAKGGGLLTAVAANMRTMAAAILVDWQGGDASFARLMTMPGPENPHFEDHAAATLAFFQGLHDSLQLIYDTNLKPVIGDSAKTVRPVLAESRLSGRSRRNIVVTMEALQALYVGEGSAGLGDLTAVADPRLDRLMRKAFRLTLAMAQSIEGPVENVAADPALRPPVKKLAKQIQAVKQIVRERLAPALGLAVGFNALDGD